MTVKEILRIIYHNVLKPESVSLANLAKLLKSILAIIRPKAKIMHLLNIKGIHIYIIY